MSRVRDRQHAERLTREAAAAIGKHVEHWKWDMMIGGLRDETNCNLDATFAPLNDAADAYEIEIALNLNVMYHKQASGLIMKMSHPDDPSGIFELLTGDKQHDFRRRMECATIMASLHLLMKKGEANGKVATATDQLS